MDSDKFIICRRFQLTLIEATNVANVRRRFRSKIYAKVSFSGNKKTEKRTPADKENETSPAWNHTVGYMIAEVGVVHHGLMLVIKLYCKRKLGDRYVGQVHMPVKELFDNAGGQGGSVEMKKPVVRKGVEEANGDLRFSYRFGESEIVERPSFWKRMVQSSASLLLRVALVYTTGVDLPIEVPIFAEPDVVDGNA